MKTKITLGIANKKITLIIVILIISANIASSKLFAQANVLCKSASESKMANMPKDTISVKKNTTESAQIVEVEDEIGKTDADSVAPAKIASDENAVIPLENYNELKVSNSKKVETINENSANQNSKAIQSKQDVILKKNK